MIRRASDEILLAAMARVGRRVWWHRAIYAALIVTFLWLASVSEAMLLDNWIRSDAPLVRWLISIGLVGVCVSILRIIWRNVGPRTESLVDVAQRIEQTHADLTGWLTSATAFAQHPDLPGQSISLRELAIQRAVDRLTAIPEANWRRYTSKSTIAVCALFVVIAAAGPFYIANLDIGLRRLFFPWQDVSWPQRIELTFASLPSLVAAGDSIEVEVSLKRGWPLPHDLVVERRISGSSEIESTPVVTHRQATAKRTMMVGTTSFEIRARGGDDQRMPWQQITVVPRASISSASILIHPPAYSRLPVEESGNVIESIRGATIEYRANTSVPIAAARLLDEHRQPLDVDIEIADDQSSITIAAGIKRPWKLLERGQVGLELTDTRGLRAVANKFDLRPRDDTPPHVELALPRTQAFATLRASLPITGSWSDDFPGAVVSVSATLVRVEQTGQSKIDLEIGSLLASESEQGMSLSGTIAGTLELATASAKPGDQIVVKLEAQDAAGQQSPTVERASEIVDSAEWNRRWRERLNGLLARLDGDARTVRSLREILGECEAAVGVHNTWNRTLQDGLEGVVTKWLPIVSAWERPDDGLLAAAREALHAAQDNLAENTPIGKLSKELTSLLERVHREAMTPLSEELFEASSLGTGAVEGPQAAQLEKLRKRLELILAKVDLFLNETSGVLARHAAEQESLELRPALQKLLGQLHRLERGWATQALKNLRSADSDPEADSGDENPQNTISLLAEQTRLAREFWQQIHTRIEAIDGDRDDLASSEALENFRRVRTMAEESPIDAWLAASLNLGRTKKATDARQQVSKAIIAVQALLDVLSDSPEGEFREKQQAMEKARQDLSNLAAAQTEIVKRLAALMRRAPMEGEASKLAAEQKRVLSQLGKIDESMNRSLVPQAASELDLAKARMNEALAAAGKSQFAPAWGAAQSARVRIEAAIAALSDDEFAAQRERIAKTIEFLKTSTVELLKRQSLVVGALDPLPNEATLAELSASELELAELTVQMAEQSKATPALSFALNAVEDELRRAGESLATPATVLPGRNWATSAQGRLQRIAEALAGANPETGEPNNTAPPDANASENPNPKKPPQRLGPSRPEIAWLQLEQHVIQERTVDLNRRREAGEQESDWGGELTALTNQQSALLKIVEHWLSGSADPANDVPGVKLPSSNSDASKTPEKDPLGNLDEQLFPRSKKEGKK
jgi:hypothetical protein